MDPNFLGWDPDEYHDRSGGFVSGGEGAENSNMLAVLGEFNDLFGYGDDRGFQGSFRCGRRCLGRFAVGDVEEDDVADGGVSAFGEFSGVDCGDEDVEGEAGFGEDKGAYNGRWDEGVFPTAVDDGLPFDGIGAGETERAHDRRNFSAREGGYKHQQREHVAGHGNSGFVVVVPGYRIRQGMKNPGTCQPIHISPGDLTDVGW